MYRFTNDLAPNFQLIVNDHANLPAQWCPGQWCQDCIRYTWRNGEALVPKPGSTSTPARRTGPLIRGLRTHLIFVQCNSGRWFRIYRPRRLRRPTRRRP
ncbi:hypothetical protein [Streptomyces sp. NPDC048419]|uniref:hypothetical protein n=1 Tax=Streptomyces sp. NPDC048419 TaxID=3365547 RepID=UPI003711F988